MLNAWSLAWSTTGDGRTLRMLGLVGESYALSHALEGDTGPWPLSLVPSLLMGSCKVPTAHIPSTKHCALEGTEQNGQVVMDWNHKPKQALPPSN